MARCEGYYRLENRRCDREADGAHRADDGDRYVLCAYHGRQEWTTTVARWHGETGLRRSTPTALRTTRQRETFAWT